MAVSLYSSALIAVAIAGAGIAGTKLRLSSAIIEVAVGIFLGNFLQVKIELTFSRRYLIILRRVVFRRLTNRWNRKQKP